MVGPQQTETSVSKEVLQEERYLWMARAFALVALVALVANLLMLMALSGLVPLMRIQPYFLQSQSKERQVISIKRADFSNMTANDFKNLEESLIREYVLARFGVNSDIEEVKRRWSPDGIVSIMSETSVYKNFNELESFPTLKLIEKEGLTRDVVVNRVSKVNQRPSRWEVAITTIDMNERSGDQTENKWLLKLEVEFRPLKRMDWSQRLKNPLGFTIKNFGRTPLEENE